MFIVLVHVHVKPQCVDAFKAASVANASSSLMEPGVIRFDVIQEPERPERFVLVEMYRTADDPARHKQTSHYQEWRDTVVEMMAEPRISTKYQPIFPDAEAGWASPRS